MKKVILMVLYLSGVGIVSTLGQSTSYTLNATGGSKTIGSNTYEWNIGEMVLDHTASSGSLVVTQGILQPKVSPNGIDIPELDKNLLSVYPIPTDNVLNILPAFPANSQLDYALYDIQGRQLLVNDIQLTYGNEHQTIPFGQYASGAYMLLVNATINNQNYRTYFKIIKK